jgi:hypothetical protein
MGEYAEYALASAMRRGFPGTCGGCEPPRRSKPRPCHLCGKGIRGDFGGMVDHLKAKHGLKDKDARASAIEARRAETAQHGSVHESAAPKADAQTPSPNPEQING